MEPSLPQPQLTPPQPNYGASYLDQIAAPATQKTLKPWQLWALIGGVLLALIVIGSMLFSGGPDVKQQFTEFIYRVESLNTLSTDNEKNIQSSALQSYNANLGAILTGIDQQSQTPLANYGIKQLPAMPSKDPLSSEYTNLSAKLDDARLNVVFDRTYAREVTYQLNTLRAEIRTIYNETSSESLKSYLETSDASLKPLVDQFANFNDS